MKMSQSLKLKSSPTIDDVARLCGLSKGTVSKALNAKVHLVSPATRKRVLQVAKTIGFRADWRARILATRRTQMVAVLNSAVSGSVPRGNYADICDHLETQLGERGYSMTFIHAREANPQLEQILGDHRFDGALSFGLIAPSILALVRRRKMPAVLINAAADETWTRIVFDDRGGTTQAMDHLLALGHRRIAFRAGMRLDHPCWEGRAGTYRQCITAAGAKPYPEHIGTAPEFVEWLLALPPANRPTAVIDFEHATAICLMQALWRAHVRVPEDLSIVSFHDTYPVAEVIPPLTVLALPSRQIAELATDMIMMRIEGDTEPQTIVVPEQLIIRESTCRRKG